MSKLTRAGLWFALGAAAAALLDRVRTEDFRDPAGVSS
jgi:hypothetical protein